MKNQDNMSIGNLTVLNRDKCIYCDGILERVGDDKTGLMYEQIQWNFFICPNCGYTQLRKVMK